jgi:hypothetical protein
MDSIEAVSFFIHLHIFPYAEILQNNLDNNKTSERLVISRNEQPFRHVTIARHPMQATEEWIQEMGKELGYEYPIIYVEI